MFEEREDDKGLSGKKSPGPEMGRMNTETVDPGLHTLDLTASLGTFNDPFTAINLLFTRKLISILGGSVWIENNGLTGTGIYFSIPIEPVPKTDYKANRFTNTVITI